MSTPSIHIFTEHKVEVDEVGNILGLISHTDRSSSRSYIGSIGLIDVFILDPYKYEFDDYSESWLSLFNFLPPKNWSHLNKLAALECVLGLKRINGGGFLCQYDTGDTIFYLAGGVLKLPERDRKYYSQYPFSLEESGRIVYEDFG